MNISRGILKSYLLCWFALFFLGQNSLTAQVVLNGKVVDKQTKEPLAFANVVVPSTQEGNTTNLNGKFTLQVSGNVDSLLVSYVGYESKKIAINQGHDDYIIELKKVDFKLSEVTVTPGNNPAHRIIRKAVKNREANNPESDGAFRLNSYNKISVFPDRTKWQKDTGKVDSMTIRMKETFSDKHLFIMETVSQRFFEAPDKLKEKVIKTQASGLENPFFFVLATQMQSFTFYHDLINIAGYRLVNPISKGSTKKYWFRIEDTTLIRGSQDTVFTISFSKRGDRSFKGMEGVVQIGTQDYAIHSVIASPALNKKRSLFDTANVQPQESPLDIEIRQKYTKVNGEKWFPLELNIDLILNNVKLGRAPMLIQGRTYIRNVELFDDLNNQIFDENAVEMPRQAGVRNDSLIGIYRVNDLDSAERNTYTFIDSLSHEVKLEKKIKAYRILLEGHIPIGPVNLPLDRLWRYNEFEKWRFGMGVTTNERFSERIHPFAYFAWSTGDKQWKYGGSLSFDLWEKHELALKAYYHNDVREVGALPQFEEVGMFNEDGLRDFLVNRMDREEKGYVSANWRMLKFAEIETGLQQRHLQFYDHYRFGVSNQQALLGLESINTSEVFVKLRYAFREQYVKTPFSKRSLGTRYPVVWLGYSRGLTIADGQIAFDKFDLQIQKDFHTKYLGSTNLLIKAGKVSGNIPVSLQYAGFGSYYDFTVHCPGSFNTMRVNEFAANDFVAVFLEHDFKKHLFRSRYFKPSVAIRTSALWGIWGGQQLNHGITYKQPDQGYFESGILVHDIISSGLSSLGVGFYYRYGSYRLPSFRENFSLKLVTKINL